MIKTIFTGLLLLAFLLTINSCQKVKGCMEPTASNYNAKANVEDGSCKFPFKPVVGDIYQGGIIAYILEQGDPGFDPYVKHGIIAASYDQSPGVQWYNGSFQFAGANGSVLGTGRANTSAIVAVQGAGTYAAKLCDDLVLDGYSDWYLPSLEELTVLYYNRAGIGNMADEFYWSSTEFTSSNAGFYNFFSGFSNNWPKGGTYRVRAIRNF